MSMHLRGNLDGGQFAGIDDSPDLTLILGQYYSRIVGVLVALKTMFIYLNALDSSTLMV